MKQYSEKRLQQRKFLVVLPLLVLPFVTGLFWALGGGQRASAHTKGKKVFGLNTELPEAFFTKEDENWNKFDLYEKAKRDSAKYRQARKSDPYFEVSYLPTSEKRIEEKGSAHTAHGLNTSLAKKSIDSDPNEEMVNQKLDELYKELERGQAKTAVSKIGERKTENVVDEDWQFASEVDRLEQMMALMQENSAADPQMQQIESVLEKILAIQHPERMNGKNSDSHQDIKAFSVEKQAEEQAITTLSQKSSDSPATTARTTNAFYGLQEEEMLKKSEATNAVEAVIQSTQELQSGSTVKLRLQDEVVIEGQRIHKDQIIFGKCSLNGERLTIDVGSVRVGNSIIPVSLSAYDLDGMEGIFIPGGITREVAKKSARQALQGVDFNSFDTSVAAQATNAGIQAVKTLFGEKVKEVKVTVKAGYKVLLFNANT